MSHPPRPEEPEDRDETGDGDAAGAREGDGSAATWDGPPEARAEGAPPARGASDEDRAWEQIVANYGEAPAWQEPPARGRAVRPDPRLGPDRPESQDPGHQGGQDDDATAEPSNDLQRGPQERFRPPPPPPVQLATPPRLVAWLGVFGVPAIVLVTLLAGIDLPSLAGVVLMFWFVGGFAYLVASMGPRREDPDDGAVL